ncbi:MAG: hypothetical protein WCC14_03830 [Acidobacteriaceae bacterium]
MEIALGNRIACCTGRSAAPVARRMKSQVTMQPSNLCVDAPNKNAFGVTPKQKQDCLNAWSNSSLGKGVQFFSLYNLATNLSSLKTWAEWTVLPAAKIGAFAVLSKMSSAIGGTELSSVVAGTTTTVTAAPVASGIATAESVGASVAPYGIGAATILDMNASAGCMGMNGDAYFSSGQVGVF